jgi:hypothetical protein
MIDAARKSTSPAEPGYIEIAASQQRSSHRRRLERMRCWHNCLVVATTTRDYRPLLKGRNAHARDRELASAAIRQDRRPSHAASG